MTITNKILKIEASESNYLRSMVTEKDIVSLDRDTLTRSDLREVVRNAKAIFLNGSSFAEGELLNHPLIKASREFTVPLVLENFGIRAMTEAVGFGLDVELAYVQRSEQLQETRIVILKQKTGFPCTLRTESDSIELHSDRPTEVGRKAAAVGLRSTAVDAGVAPSTIVETEVDPGYFANRLGELIERAVETRSRAAQRAASDYPPGTVHTWYPTWEDKPIPGVSWKPFDYDQGTYLAVSLEVTLVASSNPKAKYLKVRTTGQGAAAVSGNRSMRHDDWLIRGAFQENIHIEYGPYDGNIPFQIDRSAPANENNVTNLSSTTGFSIGVTGGGSPEGPSGSVSVSYQSSNTIQQTIKDFKSTNRSDYKYGYFDFDMSATADGTRYNSWTDLIDSNVFNPGLHGVPDLAKYVQQAITEVVWRGPADYNDFQWFTYNISQRCRATWRDTYSFFTVNYKTNSATMTIPSWYFGVNFGEVN